MSLGRVGDIADGSSGGRTKYVAYKYLGASMVVDANHPAVPTGLPEGPPSGRLTYAGATSGDYSGLDRFGRVAWQRWMRTDGDTAADRHFYGYDRAGNRKWRAERSDAADATGKRDEAYVYDGLDRLVGIWGHHTESGDTIQIKLRPRGGEAALDGPAGDTDPNVAYTWGYGLSGSAASHARLEKVILPGGREVYYNYESQYESLAKFASLNRVANIAANGSPEDAARTCFCERKHGTAKHRL